MANDPKNMSSQPALLQHRVSKYEEPRQGNSSNQKCAVVDGCRLNWGNHVFDGAAEATSAIP